MDRLAAAEPGEKVGVIEDVLRKQVSQVLRIAEGNVDAKTPLTSLGMDSLMGLELRNRIETVLGVKMPATLLWTYPTIEALSAHLLGQLDPAAGAAGAQPSQSEKTEEAAKELESQVAAMGQDDVLAMLDEALEHEKNR
jgi:acyl carrier protein